MTAGARDDAAYDRYADAYDRWWGPIIAPAAVRLLDDVDRLAIHGRPVGGAGVEVLDVGVGTGTLALAALERWPHATVIGVDPSRVMLEIAARGARRHGDGLAERLRLVTGTADRLPLPDASIDLAVSSFVIQLVRSRAAALREMLRVVRPGGAVAVLTWQVDDEPFDPDAVVDDALDELEIDVPSGARDPRPYTSPAAAAAELRRIGFRGVRATPRWLDHHFTPRSYLDLVEHWIEDDLFAGLSETRRAELRSRIIRGLEALDSDALRWRRPLVSVIGRRPSQPSSEAE